MTTNLASRPRSRTGAHPPAPAWRPAARHRRLAWIGDGIGSLAIVSVVVVVLLWIRGGNVGLFGAPGGTMTSLGRLTGLVSSDFLLLQVLLMARIPWVEQVWGQGELAKKHRWLGFTSFWLMLVHIVLITIGYAQTSSTNLFAQAWDLVIHYSGMLLATAGTLALIMVVVTSIRRARRRMRYESWHLIHLYSYLGVGLALPHQLWTGQDFLSSTAATLYWWGLWGAAIGSVLICRLVLPIVSSFRHRLVVTGVSHNGPGVFSVTMGGRKLDRMGLRAGQYCQWRFLTGTGWSRAQPFSISSVPGSPGFRITVQRVGDGSARLAKVEPGTRVLFEGPYGTMTADRRTRRDVVLIGAGVGITPLRGLAETIASEAQNQGGSNGKSHTGHPSVVVLQRAGNLAQAIFADEFTALARRPGVQVIPLIGPRAAGSEWLPGPNPARGADILCRLVPDVATREAYLCGPKPWVKQVRKSLLEAGLPKSAIHSEDFSS